MSLPLQSQAPTGITGSLIRPFNKTGTPPTPPPDIAFWQRIERVHGPERHCIPGVVRIPIYDFPPQALNHDE